MPLPYSKPFPPQLSTKFHWRRSQSAQKVICLSVDVTAFTVLHSANPSLRQQSQKQTDKTHTQISTTRSNWQIATSLRVTTSHTATIHLYVYIAQPGVWVKAICSSVVHRTFANKSNHFLHERNPYRICSRRFIATHKPPTQRKAMLARVSFHQGSSHLHLASHTSITGCT